MVSKIFSTLNIPILTPRNLNKRERETFPALESLARNSCDEALQLEACKSRFILLYSYTILCISSLHHRKAQVLCSFCFHILKIEISSQTLTRHMNLFSMKVDWRFPMMLGGKSEEVVETTIVSQVIFLHVKYIH